jgi:hypothetical protein
LVCAEVNVELAVLMPVVLNTGPLPDVLGAGRFTPFSRMQATNFVSAALAVGLLKREAPPKLPPPHFFNASWNCVALTPAGGWNLPPPPPPPPSNPPPPPPPGGRLPEGAGSVIPCFARQDLNAVNRLDPPPPGVFDACVPFDDPLELVLAGLVALLAELPHAASVQQAPRAASARPGRIRRPVVVLERRRGCMGSVVSFCLMVFDLV